MLIRVHVYTLHFPSRKSENKVAGLVVDDVEKN